jgi:hypothetical protein
MRVCSHAGLQAAWEMRAGRGGFEISSLALLRLRIPTASPLQTQCKVTGNLSVNCVQPLPQIIPVLYFNAILLMFNL